MGLGIDFAAKNFASTSHGNRAYLLTQIFSGGDDFLFNF